MSKQIWTTDSLTGRWVLTRERIAFMVEKLALGGTHRHAIRQVLIPLARTRDIEPALDVYFTTSGRLREPYRSQLSERTKADFQTAFPPKQTHPATQTP